MKSEQAERPRVVIIGAGFGGLYAARTLENKPVDVLVIDRHNYHTFTPLLYQVATCGLEAEEIAYPVRGIFRDRTNIRFLMGTVIEIHTTLKQVTVTTATETRHEAYDYLIVAGGSVTNFFGQDSISQVAFGLKTLREAVTLRNHILNLFEQATWSEDEHFRQAATTLVAVGGGPTGLETAGALYELYSHVLRREYPHLREQDVRVILIEATDRLLAPFPEGLQAAAYQQLNDLGVEVVLGNPVSEAYPDRIVLKDGRAIPTYTLIWAAGVKASPLAELLGVPLERGGRIAVKPTMETMTCDKVYVVGDMAHLTDARGQVYPMLIPVAKQQGILASHNILRRLEGHPETAFVYRDRGIMATIGRSRAVAYIYNRIPLRGFIAWSAWLALHLVALMGFRNRVNVLVNWIWNYFTFDRSVRLILEDQPKERIEVPDPVAGP